MAAFEKRISKDGTIHYRVKIRQRRSAASSRKRSSVTGLMLVKAGLLKQDAGASCFRPYWLVLCRWLLAIYSRRDSSV